MTLLFEQINFEQINFESFAHLFDKIAMPSNVRFHLRSADFPKLEILYPIILSYGNRLRIDMASRSKLQASPTALAPVADYFKVLSETSRLQVLCSLRSGAKNVSEIIDETGLGQANVSKHLKILAQAGLVSRQPQGVSVYYEITDPLIFELCELVCDRLAIRLKEQSQQLKQLNPLRQK